MSISSLSCQMKNGKDKHRQWMFFRELFHLPQRGEIAFVSLSECASSNGKKWNRKTWSMRNVDGYEIMKNARHIWKYVLSKPCTLPFARQASKMRKKLFDIWPLFLRFVCARRRRLDCARLEWGIIGKRQPATHLWAHFIINIDFFHIRSSSMDIAGLLNLYLHSICI